MNPLARAMCYAIAFVLFLIEAAKGKSLLAAGVAVAILPTTWAAVDAA